MKMTEGLASKFNAALKLLGIPLLIKFITVLQAEEMLAKNPDLLKKFNLSQKMSGDKSDVVTEKKGRPHTDTLKERMLEGTWQWYLSILYLLSNGGVIDGITRLLACVEAAKEESTFTGFWTMMYRRAEREDFKMFDDPLQARSPKDILLNDNPNMIPIVADILSVVARKAYVHTEGDPRADGYSYVATEKWLNLYRNNRAAFDAAANFIVRKGQKVVRRKLVALMHFLYVGRSGATNPKRAAELLDAYVTGISRDREEVLMRDLAKDLSNQSLHERDACLPTFHTVLQALLDGQKPSWKVTEVDGKTKILVKVGKWAKTKGAKAGK